jgi:hypothetical protein
MAGGLNQFERYRSSTIVEQRRVMDQLTQAICHPLRGFVMIVIWFPGFPPVTLGFTPSPAPQVLKQGKMRSPAPQILKANYSIDLAACPKPNTYWKVIMTANV